MYSSINMVLVSYLLLCQGVSIYVPPATNANHDEISLHNPVVAGGIGALVGAAGGLAVGSDIGNKKAIKMGQQGYESGVQDEALRTRIDLWRRWRECYLRKASA